MVLVFEFLAAPQSVSEVASIASNHGALLQSTQFVSQLEEFAGEFSLGGTALKNLVKTVLVISFHFECMCVGNGVRCFLDSVLTSSKLLSRSLSQQFISGTMFNNLVSFYGCLINIHYYCSNRAF